MDLEDTSASPFVIDNLWKPSKFSLQPLQPLDPPSLSFEECLPSIAVGLFKPTLKFDNESILYELDVFGGDLTEHSLDVAAIPDASRLEQTDEAGSDVHVSFSEPECIWDFEGVDDDPRHGHDLHSWDGFPEERHREPVSAYLSEHGACGFDAALVCQASISGLENSGRLVRPDAFFLSLLRLGLGWNSIFFQYNEHKRTFEKRWKDTRISGVSLPTLDGALEGIIRCGSAIQRIRRFVRNNPVVSSQPAALSSLASVCSVIIYGLEKRLSSRFDEQNSLLQIRALFQPCGDMVCTLASIIDAVYKVESDGEIISIVLDKCDNYAQRFDWMVEMLHEIISRVTRPWLTQVESWIGLRGESSGSLVDNRAFVGVEYSQGLKSETESQKIKYVFRPEAMPSFVPAEQAQLIFDSGHSLRLLKQASSNHPIAGEAIVANCHPPGLYCGFTWEDIERIQKKASEYESRLRSVILRHTKGTLSKPCSSSRDYYETFNEGANQNLTNNFQLINIDDIKNTTQVLASSFSLESDSLYMIVAEGTLLDLHCPKRYYRPFGPQLSSAFHLSLAPALLSQTKLIDYSCLHLLFKEHKLRYHLTLQWRFQLLGDGSFATHLSHSLFDPEMESGERKPGVIPSSVRAGLRLGSRDTWPPASSELRLVLMGLLAECHAASSSDPTRHSSHNGAKEKEPPGGLSFAIRELSGEEVVKCKDPNDIEALDFLRLQYKPPSVLETVITPRTLRKYDLLFKHLLRLTRMISVVKVLIRDSTSRSSLSGDTHNIFQRFRVDAQHFVIALNDYSFQIGVGNPWRRFENTLSIIERCIDRGNIDRAIETAGSLCKLRDCHEEVLDQILLSLLLTKAHEQASKLLEDIFRTVLAFAPLSRLDGVSGVRHENENIVFQLYVTFRKQVDAFVRYLRSLDSGRMSSKLRGRHGTMGFFSTSDATSAFEQLLLRIDLKGYY